MKDDMITPQNSKAKKSPALQIGTYSVVITAFVLALVIVINLFAQILPASWTKYDISASKLYSVTSNTKVVLNSLTDDVTIYWIVQPGAEDPILKNLLAQYDSLSEHIQIVKKNPDEFPTFAQQYTEEEVFNNSLVVECGERNRYIGFEDIYAYTLDVSGQYSPDSFDGEGAITSAIDYVTNEEQPLLLTLEGHGERPIPENFADQLTKANIETTPLSLLKVDEIPEEADALMIYSPSSDLSPDEVDMLLQYTQQGGRLFVAAGPVESGSLTNLYSLLEHFGVSTVEGIVVESDRQGYAARLPYVLIPQMGSSPLTDPLAESRYSPIIPIAQGMLVGNVPEGTQVTELLSVPATAFSKSAGYQLETYEREDLDTDGPFALGVDIQCDQGGQIIWISSGNYLEDNYNMYSSGANLELTMNAIASLVGESESMAIRTKSLDYNYLTISDSNASLLKGLLIGAFPLAYLGTGILVTLKRKKKYSETI